jgi:hypothetical protein
MKIRVHFSANPLFVSGDEKVDSAGTQELKNAIWGQIKLVDPGYSDLTCDILIDPAIAPQGPPAPEMKT